MKQHYYYFYINLWESAGRDFGDFLHCQKQFTEMFEFLRPSHLLLLHRHHRDVEVIIHVQDLVKVFFLHFWSSLTHAAIILWEQHLIHYNISNVNFEGRQLLDEPVSFVEWEKFGNADCDESGFVLSEKVNTLSFICSLTLLEDSLSVYILLNIFSKVLSISSFEPNIPDIPLIMPLNFYFKVRILFNPFSKMFGKFRNRKVCPVGAVSKTTTSKSIFSIELNYFTATLLIAQTTLPHRCQAQSWIFIGVGSSCPDHRQNWANRIIGSSSRHPLWGRFPESDKCLTMA